MVMSTVLFYLIVAAKRTMYAFGLCFYVWGLFTPILKHLILLAKQAIVCKTLIFTPPSTTKQCSLDVGGDDFYRGCFPQSNVLPPNPLTFGKYLIESVSECVKNNSTPMLTK